MRFSPVHYRGVVWCVRVPTGAFVARRNGKVFVTGNSGFPKSLDVSKAIDATDAVGSARPEDVRRLRMGDDYEPTGRPRSGEAMGGGVLGPATAKAAPASPAAIRWDGYGTTTKPAFEPLIVARKALDGTVATNVQKHGCGALNIDAARIGTHATTTHRNGDSGGNGALGRDTRVGSWTNPPGRFPAALALVHDEGCVCEGTRRVRGDARTGGGKRPGGFGNVGAGRGNGAPCAPGHADPDGMETVDVWTCTATCAVAELGRQSGESASRVGNPRAGANGDGWGMTATGAEYDDTGTAARFFYQASWDMRETPKRCSRCGLLLPASDGTVDRCDAAKTAAESSTGNQGSGSVDSSAQASQRLDHGDSNQNKSASARLAESDGLISSATIESSAPRSVLMTPTEHSGHPVSDVAHRADSCGIGTAPSHAPRGPSSTLPQPLGHLFTDAHNSPIPSSNRVPAVNPASTGTTPTTPNPMKWCGCAPLVTSDTTTPERPEGTVSDPTSRFRYVAKASSRDRLAYITCTAGCAHHESVAFVKDARDSARDASREHPHGFCRACNGIRTHYQHATVKPLDLAKYHARLLSLPPHTRPIALVPFCGTGIEARALLDVGFRVIAIDLDPRHCAMTEFRLTHKEPNHVTEERAAVAESERGDWTKPIRVPDAVADAPAPSARKEQLPLFGGSK